jgi:hypothetical protein
MLFSFLTRLRALFPAKSSLTNLQRSGERVTLYSLTLRCPIPPDLSQFVFTCPGFKRCVFFPAGRSKYKLLLARQRLYPLYLSRHRMNLDSYEPGYNTTKFLLLENNVSWIASGSIGYT